MIIDSPSDPIPSANKVFDVETLGANEKHVGLKKVMLSSLVENLAITAIAKVEATLLLHLEMP